MDCIAPLTRGIVGALIVFEHPRAAGGPACG